MNCNTILTFILPNVYYQLIVRAGGDIIKNQATISKREVKLFIDELKRVLTSDVFNADTDFFINIKDKPGNDHYYSNLYTLQDLEYDTHDVIGVLSSLTVADYSETVFDKDDSNPILLHVFGREINSRLIYIKLKLRESDRKYIVCVSFHYAKNKMVFPYR